MLKIFCATSVYDEFLFLLTSCSMAATSGCPSRLVPFRLHGVRFRNSRPCHKTSRHLFVHSSSNQNGGSDLPPGDLNFWRETLAVVSDGDNFGVKRHAQHGNVYKTNLLGQPTVMVYDGIAVRAVLGREGNGIEVTWPEATATLVGPRSLNLLAGEEHARVKQLLTVAFSASQLPAYAVEVHRILQQFAAGWQSSSSPPDLLQECKLLAFATVSRCFLGLPSNTDAVQHNLQLMDDLAAGFNSPTIALPGLPYSKAVAARAELLRQMDAVLDDDSRSKQGAASGAPGTGNSTAVPGSSTGPVLVPGILYAARLANTGSRDGAGLSRADLQDNAIAALFGNVSAGPTIFKVFQYVSSSHRRRLRAELEAAGAVSDTQDSLDVSKLGQCSYLDAVVAEVLRITPAVPVVFRKASTDVSVGQYTVPQGYNVWPHLGDAVLRYNQDVFDPERWLDTRMDSSTAPGQRMASSGQAEETGQRSEQRGEGGRPGQCPFEFSAPFGASTRVCLGRPFMMMQLKVITAALAWHYDWELSTPGGEGVSWTIVPTPRPKSQVQLSFTARQ